jgi:AraC-like DNA-binding protein
MKNANIYAINDFEKSDSQSQVYVNRLGPHVKSHAFTNLPHKHDFYLFMLVTKGNGEHEIDFKKYKVKPGSVFLMQPGQMHFWKLSKNIDGYVFFHSKEFYEKEFTRGILHQFKFFESFQSEPRTEVDKRTSNTLKTFLEDMLSEFRSAANFRSQKLHALMNLVYIEIARVYSEKQRTKSPQYLELFHQFELLVEEYYLENKLPGFYAAKLNITDKHLNRVCKACVNKTSTQLIAERVALEAKRMLSQFKENVTEISFDLGFSDPSYFIRFFKKQTGETPLNFQRKYLS